MPFYGRTLVNKRLILPLFLRCWLSRSSWCVYTKRQLQVLQKRERRSSNEEGQLLSIEINATTPGRVPSSLQCVHPSTSTRHT
ncbi:unnamed protein product [Peronospora destructor]|uniref:Secreted protein n=1 Tax=Peronospora destructor TaxID=86335 RepID=A0AAV0TK29_9STRA|nr:unnamed protein product [Peronospora destructor]